MSESTRMMLGLVIGIVVMIVLVMKTKIHTFIALLLAAMIAGLIGGMPVVDIAADASGNGAVTGVLTAIKDGFGNTLKSTGIIIGLGVMMGGILEVSGAAEQLAFTFIKMIGDKKEEWALALTGWVVSIPVFADSAIVIFAPLVKAMSSVTGISVVGLALSLACGLQMTHTMVPPTPGPLTAAGLMGVDVGQMILLGMVVSIPMIIVIVPYCKWIGKKIYQVPANTDTGFERKDFKQEYIKTMGEVEHLLAEKNLPSFGISIAPIIVPIVLIFIKTFYSLFGSGEGILNTVISLFGEPIVALAIGTVIAVYGLAGYLDKDEVINIMNNSVKDTGLIMLITGAGGSLGNVIKVSGIGNVLGDAVVSLPIPAILIPFIIAALMRIALGSATVAITTAASLTAPLMASIAVSPLLLAMSCCVGAISFSYFNDSGFWVFNGMFGLTDIKDQVKCKTAVSMIMAGVGVVMLLILQIFIH